MKGHAERKIWTSHNFYVYAWPLISYLRLFHLRMEILRALNQPLVWRNDGGRKDFIYLDFVSVICKE